MAAFARGTYAVAFCQRCGLPWKYGELRADGDVKGLQVCPECWDEEHPQEKPKKARDPIALRRPAIEIVDYITQEQIYPFLNLSTGTFFGQQLAVFVIGTGSATIESSITADTDQVTADSTLITADEA